MLCELGICGEKPGGLRWLTADSRLQAPFQQAGALPCTRGNRCAKHSRDKAPTQSMEPGGGGAHL